MRAVALASGARPDDTLLLGFNTGGTLDVEVRQGTGHVPQPDKGAAEATIFAESI